MVHKFLYFSMFFWSVCAIIIFTDTMWSWKKLIPRWHKGTLYINIFMKLGMEFVRYVFSRLNGSMINRINLTEIYRTRVDWRKEVSLTIRWYYELTCINRTGGRCMLRFFHCKVLFRYVDFVFFALMMEIGFSNDENCFGWKKLLEHDRKSFILCLVNAILF